MRNAETAVFYSTALDRWVEVLRTGPRTWHVRTDDAVADERHMRVCRLCNDERRAHERRAREAHAHARRIRCAGQQSSTR